MSAQFAYAQWPWGVRSKEEFIQSCKDLHEVGFSYFESVKSFIDTFADDVEGFKSICQDYDVRPISFYFHLSGDYEADIAELTTKIPFVEKNGIRTISVQGAGASKPATEEELRYAVRTISEYGRIAKDYGVLPCVHPHYNTTIMRESEIDFVMRNTDPALVAFGPDTAHLSAGGCDPKVIFERYRERIRFTHLKDLKGALVGGGIQDGVEVYGNFRELGEGDIDFGAIFDVLKGVGYSGYLCVELDRSRFGNKESAAINMRYLQAHW